MGAGGAAYTFTGDWTRVLIVAAAAVLLSVFTIYVYWYEAAQEGAKSRYAAEATVEAIEG